LNQQKVGGRKCKRRSGNHKDVVIRIRSEDQRELRFLKGMLPQMNSMTPDGEVVQLLIAMYLEKRIGMLSAGKGFKMPIEKDENVNQFLDNKKTEQALKDYEYLLEDKQQTLDSYIKYLDVACELGKLDKKQVIEIVQKKRRALNRDVLV
jgi:hypothetical protein